MVNGTIQYYQIKIRLFIYSSLEDTKSINHVFEAEQFDAVVNLAAQAGVQYSIENPQRYI